MNEGEVGERSYLTPIDAVAKAKLSCLIAEHNISGLVIGRGCLYSLDWTTRLDYWTHPKMPFPAIFSVGQKLNTYAIDSPKLLA